MSSFFLTFITLDGLHIVWDNFIAARDFKHAIETLTCE